MSGNQWILPGDRRPVEQKEITTTPAGGSASTRWLMRKVSVLSIILSTDWLGLVVGSHSKTLIYSFIPVIMSLIFYLTQYYHLFRWFYRKQLILFQQLNWINISTEQSCYLILNFRQFKRKQMSHSNHEQTVSNGIKLAPFIFPRYQFEILN